MTLILPRTELAKDFITGGQNNVGLRVPSQSLALALLKKFEDLGGQGVAAPSANRFGAVSPTTAQAVKEELGNFLDFSDLVLDGGHCLVGIESTIIDCVGISPKVLRPGAIFEEMIEKVLNEKISNINEITHIKASGLLNSHYSPNAEILLNESSQNVDGFLALSNIPTPHGAIRLASPNSIEQFARVLYESFRLADQLKLKIIRVIVPEGDGLALAIRDRAMKASIK
jgi:L-threonylcarbamoyladenylate synthase